MFCSKCGKELEKGAIFCDGCRVLIRIPKGLNVASIILVLISILGLLCGIFLIVAIFTPAILDEFLKSKVFEGLTEEILVKYRLVLTILILLSSVLYLVVSLGLRRLKRWAGILGVIFCVLNLILGYKNILGSLVNILIIILIVGNWRYLGGAFRKSNL